MANMLDYLVWRGDLSLEQAGIGPVDALILSELSYLHFDRLVPEEPGEAPAIRELSQAFLEFPEDVQKIWNFWSFWEGAGALDLCG